ncbi:MAG: esterase/lipase family protein [Pseudomonadales bacterium]
MRTQPNRTLSAPPPGALLNESLTALELPRLLLQAPRLVRATRGTGQRVLVLPGYGADDSSTALIRGYLRFLGYRPAGWGLGRNDADVLALLERLRSRVAALAEEGPIRLVGWSLGGYLAREVARDCPEAVGRVVTLGSPVVGGPKYTSVARLFAGLDDIEALVDARYATPLTVPVTAVYSRLDGVVSWQACIDDRSPNVEHVEVSTTHIGLGFSPEVLRIIADRCAQPD